MFNLLHNYVMDMSDEWTNEDQAIVFDHNADFFVANLIVVHTGATCRRQAIAGLVLLENYHGAYVGIQLGIWKVTLGAPSC